MTSNIKITLKLKSNGVIGKIFKPQYLINLINQVKI